MNSGSAFSRSGRVVLVSRPISTQSAQVTIPAVITAQPFGAAYMGSDENRPSFLRFRKNTIKTDAVHKKYRIARCGSAITAQARASPAAARRSFPGSFPTNSSRQNAVIPMRLMEL